MGFIGYAGWMSIVMSITCQAATPPADRYETVVNEVTSLQAQFPDTSRIFSIGKNDEGTEMIAIRISTTPAIADPKKIAHVIVATHHGNESACPVFASHFTKKLLERYRSSELYRGNLADTEWTVIPVLNISGYNKYRREERGMDPNRDYPGLCNSFSGGRLKSIRTLMDYLKSRVFVGSVTVHGYVGSLTYPWGVDAYDTHTLDHNLFDSITEKAAALNGYKYGTSTDIVYPADNTYEDYAYYKHGLWSLLLELRNGSSNDVQTTTEALFTYFDALDSSPSLKNQFTSQCKRDRRPDLHME
jgi:hypothetical protein